MALGIFVFITWCVIITLPLIPKKLSQLEMIFLFFINTIYSISLFTLLDLNLKLITADHSPEKSFTVMTYRMVAIPLLAVISSNVLLYTKKALKYISLLGIVVFLTFGQYLLVLLHVLRFNHWNLAYSIILFTSFIGFTYVMTRFITYINRKDLL